ncbi:MAG: Gfo/Idh/MocA family oxidoreductase [Ruminococcaceae bacterium]|nr:Gfo/Idh/MocA family oxidoreductase [Oscillospiraceae bacterium]
MLKVGLIGCGFMGAMHANCYKNIKDVEIVAFADIRSEKAEELAKGTNAVLYGDGKELIASADVDIIDICLPTFLHADYAMAAMEKVKYVFVEKPVALTKEEGKAMLEKSKETGAQVQVGQVIRFWDEYVELKKIIESGVYGKVINANFRRLSPRPDWGWKNWLLDYKLSGGAGQDLHIHDVDYVLSVFGQPKNFYSVKNVNGESNSYVNTLMQYDDFVVGVEGTWDLPVSYPFTATFRVVFENAVVENAGGKFMLYTNDGASEIEIEKKEFVGGVEGGNISDLGGYYNELVYFCDKAKMGEKIEKATLCNGVSSLEFLLKELAFNA